jgi:hypothetical protein
MVMLNYKKAEKVAQLVGIGFNSDYVFLNIRLYGRIKFCLIHFWNFAN